MPIIDRHVWGHAYGHDNMSISINSLIDDLISLNTPLDTMSNNDYNSWDYSSTQLPI